MRRIFLLGLLVGCHRDLDVNPCSHDPASCEETGADSGADTAIDSTAESEVDSTIEDTGLADSVIAESSTDSSGDGATETAVADTTVADSAVADTAIADTCTCIPGEKVAGAGTCTAVLEKKTKTCAASCTWGPEMCALPKGWTAIADSPIEGRVQATSVWTGGELIIFGGGKYLDAGESSRKDGAIFSLAKNSWTTLAMPTSATAARKRHAAVWTGTEMIVWGGMDGETLRNDGLTYDAFAKTWDVTAASPLTARERVAAVWMPTVKKMFVWGGDNATTTLSDGALYEPNTFKWSTLPAAPISARWAADAFWTGKEVLIWGGQTATTSGAGANDGALYDPATNTWRAIAAAPIKGRLWAATGFESDTFVAFAGTDLKDYFVDGARLALTATPTWAALSAAPAGFGVRQFPQGWFGGGVVIAWSGGYEKAGILEFFGDGYAYNVAAGTWSTMPSTDAPTGRAAAVALWTGKCGLVWSGYHRPAGGIAELATSGAVYLP